MEYGIPIAGNTDVSYTSVATSVGLQNSCQPFENPAMFTGELVIRSLLESIINCRIAHLHL